MKKLLYIPLILLAICCKAQNPTIITNPYQFLKWISVHDSIRAGIIFIGTNDTAATQAYVRAHSGGGGSVNPGYGIRISNDSVILDTANVRKMDSLYTVTDSTGIFKINGRAYAFKLRGALWSFNGRTQNIIPQSGDYAAFYPQFSGSYSDPSWINSLSWLKVIGTPNSLGGYGILNGVINASGGYSWGADLYVNRPAPAHYGAYFYATDSNKIYFDNGTAWTGIAGGGGGPDSVIIGSYGILTTVSGTTKTFKIDTTTLKSVFGASLGGIVQLYTKGGLFINGTDTASLDTTVALRWQDTLTKVATQRFVTTRGYIVTETDPVAIAKTMTHTGGSGILVTGGTQALSTNPVWTYKADTSVVATLLALKDTAINIRAVIAGLPAGYDSTIMEPIYRVDTAKANLRTSIAGKQPAGSYLTSESDPVAIAKTISDSAAYGVLISGLKTQALNLNPFWTFKVDTSVIAPLHRIGDTAFVLRSLFAAGGQNLTAGSGLTGGPYNGSAAITLKADTSLLSTLLALKDTAAAIRGTLPGANLTLTLGSGLLGGSYNGGAAVTAKVDSSLYATVTSLGRQGFKTVGVDSIWRVVGEDSILFTINGRQHSILDSAGAGSVVDSAVLAGYAMTKTVSLTKITLAWDSTAGAVHGQGYNDARYHKSFLDSLATGLIIDSTIIAYKGNPGDTLFYGSHDTLYSFRIRDSLNFHHAFTPDGGLVMWSTSSGGTSPPFNDNTALIQNNSDNTKKLIFSAAGVTTSNTRTLTAQDNNYTIAGINISQTFSNTNTFNSPPIFSGLTGYLKGNNTSAISASSSVPTTDLSGNLSITNFNSGTGASSTTAWFGDGSWKTVTGGGGNIPLDSVLKTGPTSTRSMAVGGFKTTGADTLSGTTYNATKGKVVTIDTVNGILYHQSVQTIDTTGAASGKTSPLWNGSNQFIMGGPFLVADSTVTISSGSSSTVPNACNVIVFTPSSALSTYNLTLPSTWHVIKDLLIVFPVTGSISVGNNVVTTLTITNGAGQTLSQAVTPTTATAGEIIRYHLISGTIDQRTN